MGSFGNVKIKRVTSLYRQTRRAKKLRRFIVRLSRAESALFPFSSRLTLYPFLNIWPFPFCNPPRAACAASTWRRKRTGKLFFLTRVLALFFDARAQLDLIRILRPRRATRLQKSADNHDDGKQYGPHARDDAIRSPVTSITNR